MRPNGPLRDNASTPRILADKGDVARSLRGSPEPLERTYVWPYQMHASIGPSCAVAHWSEDQLVVWSGTQNPFPMRADLARLLDMPADQITVERLEAAGCYGRNCADDVTADAALLSRAAGRPVRVQLTREQEHAWSRKARASRRRPRRIGSRGRTSGYDFETRYPSNLAPTLPLILTGKSHPCPTSHPWATEPRSRLTPSRTCASPSMTCRRSRARHGSAAFRRCPHVRARVVHR